MIRKDFRSLMQKNQGFTLVEIAVVLVIIGVLLGGVLQGTKLIENSKVRKAVGELEGVAAAYHAYQDKYRRQPGDDGDVAALRARGGDWSAVPRAGNRNGTVQVRSAQTFNGDNEHWAFWQHLRAAGLILGDPTLNSGATIHPVNAYGGRTGVTNATVLSGLTGLKVCLSEIPGASVLAMDNQADDGSPATGRLRASEAVAGSNTPPNATAATAYSEENIYSVCLRM